MSSTTPNLSLTLYDSTTDQSVSFATFRAVWGGPALTSNFYKIDTAYGVQAAQIATLTANRGAITVAASYISANYYEANGVTAITSYVTNMNIILSVDTTSSGTVTLNINSLGTKSVSKVDSTGTIINLTGSDLVEGRQYLFTYNGTQWLWVSANSADQIQIVGTSGNVVTVGSTNNLDGTLTQSLMVSQTIHSAATKTTLADADEFGTIDSAASYVLKRTTWANIKTMLDLLFAPISKGVTNGDSHNHVGGDGGGIIELPQNIQFSGDISPSQITSSQNDYNPTDLSTSSVLRLTSDANWNITGLAGGSDGRVIIIRNIGSFIITLKNNSSSSTSSNRFSFSSDMIIYPDKSVILQYDSTVSLWKTISTTAISKEVFGGHGQGSGIPASSSRYIVPFINGIQSTAYSVPVPSGILSNLFVRQAGTQPGTSPADDMVVEIYSGPAGSLSPTGIKVTFVGGSSATDRSDTTNTFSHIGGHHVQVVFTNSSTSTSAVVGGVSFEIIYP